MKKLFDEKIRTDSSYSKHSESDYGFYDRCSHDAIEELRQALNEWFDRYPETEKEELRSRLKSRFSSAFFELFIHELFYQLGFELIPHPSIPRTSKHPDFLVKKGGFEFYVEAREVTDKSDSERSHANKMNSFYDELNKLDSPNFFVKLNNIVFKTSEQPSAKIIRRYLEDEIRQFDPETFSAKIEMGDFEEEGDIFYEDSKVRVSISLIPKSTESRGKAEFRPIGMYPVESFWGVPDESLKTAIEKKATRYGYLDKPYIVCINSTGIFGFDNYSTLNALFGRLKLSISTNPDARDEKWFRARDGIFMGPHGPHFTRVSGVFITSVYPSNLHVAKYNVYEHPFSKKPLDFSLLDLNYTFVKGSELEAVAGKEIKEILKIPDNWMQSWFSA